MKHFLAACLALSLLAGGGFYYVRHRENLGMAKSTEITSQLELARAFLSQGKATEALGIVTALEQSGARMPEDADWIASRAEQSLGNHAAAIRRADALLSRTSSASMKQDAELIRLSSIAASRGLNDPATLQQAEAFLATNAGHPDTALLEAELGRQELAQGRIEDATQRFERLWRIAPDAPGTRGLAAAIGNTNMQRLLSADQALVRETHSVARGEAVFNIARKHQVTSELMLQVNKIDNPKNLRVGQALKIPDTDWSLECDVAANALILRNHGRFFKLYEVRTGRDPGTTPEGTFKVLNKKENPTWRPGDGRVYHPGDPNNELGTRWMAFEGDILGIHGTIREETVGAYASNGCIGMRKEEVEELYNLILVGTPLTIVGRQDPARHRIIAAPTVPPPREMASR